MVCSSYKFIKKKKCLHHTWKWGWRQLRDQNSLSDKLKIGHSFQKGKTIDAFYFDCDWRQPVKNWKLRLRMSQYQGQINPVSQHKMPCKMVRCC